MFFSQTIDYTTNRSRSYFYYPASATSASANGVTREVALFGSGTSDIILDNDRLYIGGAPNAPNSCGTFQKIFVSAATVSSAIPDIEVLKFGYTGKDHMKKLIFIMIYRNPICGVISTK